LTHRLFRRFAQVILRTRRGLHRSNEFTVLEPEVVHPLRTFGAGAEVLLDGATPVVGRGLVADRVELGPGNVRTHCETP
jgi:hypothetical protein